MQLMALLVPTIISAEAEIMQKKVEAPRARDLTTIYRSGCELLVSSQQERKVMHHMVMYQ